MSFDLKHLLDRVAAGDLDVAQAAAAIDAEMRAQPVEDLGFARIDHQRAQRQGFPEVILGLGKSPDQIAAIAERIVARGHTLLVTRADPAAYDAVHAVVPAAEYHHVARAITCRMHEVPAGRGTIMSPPPARRICPWPRKPPSPPR